MSRTETHYIGKLNVTKEQASELLADKWARYENALQAAGDVLEWKGDPQVPAERVEELKQRFGYFRHEETQAYEEFEKKDTTWRNEYSSPDDDGHVVYVDNYAPVSKQMTSEKTLKVVRHGTAKKVAKLEKTFFSHAADYYAVEAGYSSELPKKWYAVVYNVSQLLSGLFLFLWLLCGPTLLSPYAQSLSPDLLLYGVIGGTEPLQALPAWLGYVGFALGIVSLFGFFFARGQYDKFVAMPRRAGMHVASIAAIVAFGLGFLMTPGYQKLGASNNPLLWIPIGLFGAGRALCFLLSIVSVIMAVVNLLTGYPHKQICAAVSSNSEHLDEYVGSGAYQKDKDLFDEIASYTVKADFKRIAEIRDKIAELEAERQKYLRRQEHEFTDESEKIAELDKRLARARQSLNTLLSAIDGPVEKPAKSS